MEPSARCRDLRFRGSGGRSVVSFAFCEALKLKNWKHFEVHQSGICRIFNDEVPSDATFECGHTSTGRSRVFTGYFATIALPDGRQFTGESEGSLREALVDVATQMAGSGWTLQCFGLDERWEESGLSFNTGWGYAPGYDAAVHMMMTPSQW